MTEHKEEASFRYYPLMSETGMGRTVVPVEPLQPPPHRVAPLKHLLKPYQTAPAASQMPPMIPQTPMPTIKTPMIPPTFPQMPQMPQAIHAQQAPSPQKAAEQFRQMNKNLPDGVKYEPLDDEIMKILREKNPQFKARFDAVMPPEPVSPSEPPSPLPSEVVEILKGMAQCEKSMYTFFKNFPDNTALLALSEDSEKRMERLNALININSAGGSIPANL
ncbi:MAG: hypothetical protein FWF78_04125 [Defluviitaleaceae bacterium]|nr:hypothetical protein [Defluviitaleaceae bacterium]